MARNTLSRSLHDLGLSAWFGGTLANAVSLNPASAQASTAPAAPIRFPRRAFLGEDNPLRATIKQTAATR